MKSSPSGSYPLPSLCSSCTLCLPLLMHYALLMCLSPIPDGEFFQNSEAGEEEPPTGSPTVPASSLTSQVVFESSSLPGGEKWPGQQETVHTLPW